MASLWKPGASTQVIPARKNPLVYAGLALDFLLIGVARRRGGLWWILGVAGLFGLYVHVMWLYRNAPTPDVLGVSNPLADGVAAPPA